MKVTLTTSSAAKIVVWQEGDLYHARRLDLSQHPQVCLAVDLFEVIAELGELDLEKPSQATEATKLSEQALAALKTSGTASGQSHDGDSGKSVTYESSP
jgi:hypothetical protein